jgi:hypothetical protein
MSVLFPDGSLVRCQPIITNNLQYSLQPTNQSIKAQIKNYYVCTVSWWQSGTYSGNQSLPISSYIAYNLTINQYQFITKLCLYCFLMAVWYSVNQTYPPILLTIYQSINTILSLNCVCTVSWWQSGTQSINHYQYYPILPTIYQSIKAQIKNYYQSINIIWLNYVCTVSWWQSGTLSANHYQYHPILPTIYQSINTIYHWIVSVMFPDGSLVPVLCQSIITNILLYCFQPTNQSIKAQIKNYYLSINTIWLNYVCSVSWWQSGTQSINHYQYPPILPTIYQSIITGTILWLNYVYVSWWQSNTVLWQSIITNILLYCLQSTNQSNPKKLIICL